MSEVSRRRYLKYVGGAVAVAAVAAAGYGVYQYTKPKPKKELIALTPAGRKALLDPHLSEFEEEFGVTVSIPEYDTPAMVEKAVTSFAADVNPYDAIICNSYWHFPAWVQGGYAKELDEYHERDNYPDFNDFPWIVPAHMSIFERDLPYPGVKLDVRKCWPYDPAKHRILGVPFIGEGKIFMYRQDWFAAEGLEGVGGYGYYDTLPDQAKVFTKDAEGRPITDPNHGEMNQWGYAYYDPNALGCTWMEEALPAWDTCICDENFNPILDAPKAVDALQWNADCFQVHKIVPPGSEGLTSTDNLEYMKADKLATVATWGVVFGGFLQTPGMEEKVAFTSMPTKVYSGSCHAGWTAMIPYNAGQPDLGWEFIKWATSTETEKKMQADQPAYSPARYSVLGDPAQPWPTYRAAMLSLLEKSTVPAMFPEYAALVNDLAPMLTDGVYGRKTCEDACKGMNDIVRTLFKEAGYIK